VASADIDLLARDPAGVRRILFADEENWTVTRPKGLVGFLLRFTPLSVETVTRKEPLSPEDLNRIREIECDLEGAWHGLHFLFTGTAWEGDEPACYLVRGGDAVGDEDSDEPPRLLRPELVRGFSRFWAGYRTMSHDIVMTPERMTQLSIDPDDSV
jgi:hypothetical protein